MSEAKPNRAASKTSAIVDENLSSITYEAALTELESIIARIESGDVALEESLRQYRRGAALVPFFFIRYFLQRIHALIHINVAGTASAYATAIVL